MARDKAQLKSKFDRNLVGVRTNGEGWETITFLQENSLDDSIYVC